MQSYKVNIVSEHLKDRHPYLELPFVDRYDNTEVYHAVFDRAIPKLVEILLMRGLDNMKYLDALLTLNEMVSHQENKDQMISLDLVEISSFFCHHIDVGIRREAMLLLGSLVTIMRGRERMNKHTYEGLSNMLFDDHLEARQNCAWTISRVAMSRDGVDLFVKHETIAAAIDSFLRYTEHLRDEEGKFYVYLLETFSYFLQFDSGIEFFIGKGILRRVNDILERKDDSSLKEYKRRIQYLCLEFTMKFTTNHEGKEEGIQEKVILTASKYLMSDCFDEVKFAAMVIMTCSILLEGKMQCVENPNDKIIKDLIVLLDRDNQDLRRYVKNALSTVCEYPKGALLITKYLSKHINYLDEIFGIKMIKHLAVELPKFAELGQPPNLPSDKAEDLKIYAHAIGYFLKKYEEAVSYACENTFKLSERLAPFLLYKNDKNLQELTANALYKICKHDEYNRGYLQTYFEKAGTVKHPSLGTTLASEIAKFTKLYQLIENQQHA